jgi:hypothetical protein
MCFSLKEDKLLEITEKMKEVNSFGYQAKTLKNVYGHNGFNFPITADQKTFDMAHAFCEQEYINYGILDQGESLSPSDVMCVAIKKNQEIAGTLAFSTDLYFREYYREGFPDTAFVLSKFSLSTYLRKKKEEQGLVVKLLFEKMRKFAIRHLETYNGKRPPIFLETHPAVVNIFHSTLRKRILIPQNVSLIIENTPKKSAGFYNKPGVTVYEINPEIFS